MTKIIVLSLFLFICFTASVLGKPVHRLKAENVRDGCACENFTCGCCANLVVPQISLNNSICFSFGFEPKTYGISLALAFDDKALINETISATNPPPLCFTPPLIKQAVEGCIHFSDVAVSNKKFKGCAQLELRMWKLYVVAEYKLGCFDANNLTSQQAKILKLFSKFNGVNDTEKESVVKSNSVLPKAIY